MPVELCRFSSTFNCIADPADCTLDVFRVRRREERDDEITRPLVRESEVAALIDENRNHAPRDAAVE